MRPFIVPLVVLVSLTGISAALLYVLLKKDDDDDFEPTVYTARQTVIKMKIPKDLVGVLIGRQGANIKLIQDESGARACFDRAEATSDEFRLCTIYGTAVTAQKAETLINEFIQNQPKVETLEMTVNQKYCGRIIGRSGTNIRMITNTSHAKVILSDDYDSDERKITIKGTAEQIATARDLILKTIKEQTESLEELRDITQNRSPRVTPKFQGKFNGALKLPFGSNDSLAEMLSPPGGDKALEVFVSALESPEQFWVQVINENGTKLDKLLDDMTDYYNQPENQDLHTLTEISEGQTVAAVFPDDGKWYRAEIVSVKENEEQKKEVAVSYVDFGDCRTLEENQVMELRTDFLTLRFQAIECFLAGIKPIDGKWSDEACDLFERLSHAAQWVKLQFDIKTYENRTKSRTKKVRPVPGVELIDTRENTRININEELVKAGFAQRIVDDYDSSETTEVYFSQSTSQTPKYRAVPEHSDSGSDIDGFYMEY